MPLRGKVLDIPNEMTVDVSGLDLGDKTTCKELELPAKVSLVGDDDMVLVLVQSASVKATEPTETEKEAVEAAEAVETEE